MALSARGLVLRYRRTGDVLRGADLDLRAGEVVAFVGLNGAGKSTLLRALAGLLAPAEGTVLLDGRPLAARSRAECARAIAFVPQALAALPPATVRRFVLGGRYAHLDFWRTPRAADHAAVERALHAADILGLRDRPLAELSGGELQRAMFARALAQEAGVLLCDEPVAALDLPHQLGILDLLAGLAGEGCTVAFSTHDLNLAAQYADRVVVLHGGAIRAQGPPGEALDAGVVREVWGARVCVDRTADGRVRITPARSVSW
ncbi:MAG TPA: ABC transporter ATP-binding protein [Planctomycetota bacterium]|nr:ABC transporter ATP-binding protein [Planctomycetota bacterium]